MEFPGWTNYIFSGAELGIMGLSIIFYGFDCLLPVEVVWSFKNLLATLDRPPPPMAIYNVDRRRVSIQYDSFWLVARSIGIGIGRVNKICPISSYYP